MAAIALTRTTEGPTKLLVPDLKKYGIPEHAPVFYNPKMVTDRSISVLVIKHALNKHARVADVLSGLGARAVRYANEAAMDVTANDIQPSAVSLIKRNARLNGVAVGTTNKEANVFLLEHKSDKFDCVDIDPFGSPAEFINSSFFAIKPKKSLLCVTATDTGALSGAYPKACFRKYFVVSGRTSFAHELGVRNLVAAIFKDAAKFAISVEPLMCYAHQHYYRCFLRLASGRKSTNRRISELGYVGYCPKCDYREVFPLFREIKEKCVCGGVLRILGPTWTTKIHDKKFLEKLADKHRVLGLCYEEADLPWLYYDIHGLYKKHRIRGVAKMDHIIEKLKEKGYRASRTVFSGYGIKTNADFAEFRKILEKC